MRNTLLATLMLLSLTGEGFSREVKVRGPVKELSAHVVPASNWCSTVVSVELRGPKASFIQKPEDTQRLIGGVRIGVLEDCPEAEIIRIRGVDKGKSLFLAYSEKSENWPIRVAEAEPELLNMLKLDKGKEESVRKIAMLETKSHMARIGVQGIEYDSEIKDKEDVRQNWKLKDIEGSTFLTFNRAERINSLGELANMFADATIGECKDVDNLAQDSLPSGIEIRGFDCKQTNEIIFKMIAVVEINNIATTYITSSKDKQELQVLNRLIADKSTLY